MTDLLDALGAAKEGSRELDCQISKACFDHADCVPDGPMGWKKPPEYTRSIDAALQLVPEGWHACIKVYAGDIPTGGAEVWSGYPAVPHVHFNIGASTAPLAICIAALRARAAHDTE